MDGSENRLMSIKILIEKKSKKSEHHPTHKRNKKYFGGSLYDFGLLHGDEGATGENAGADGGGDGNRSEDGLGEEQIEEKKGKKRKAAKKKHRKKKKAKKAKRDACYHKVRSRYDVWPSAYASGALVKCRKVGAKNWGNKSKTNESLNESEDGFKPHMMYDPKSNKSEMTQKIEDHERLAKKGYTHVDPDALRKVLEDEGGASGLDPFLKAIGKELEDEIISTLSLMPDVGQHKDKDYILDDDQEIDVIKEIEDSLEFLQEIDELFSIEEKKKKKRKNSKLTSKPSSEKSLHHWFSRKGAKGKKKGWVDCNAPDGKGGYKSCGRGDGEKRKKYPACRPTPGACKKSKSSKGKSWGKKGSKKK